MPGPYSVVEFSCLIIPQTGLQYNAILKDGDLAEALLLGAGLLAGATSSTSWYRSAPASSSVRSPSATTPALKSIQVFFLAASWLLVAIFSVGRGGTKRRAAARAEQHHVRTRSSQRRGGDQVVAGAVQHVQALGGDGLAVVDDIHDRRGAAFLHAAAGLVLQRRDAALLVARARVVVETSLWLMKYSLKPLIILTAFSKTCSFWQRSIRKPSAPNISGTSVSTVEPPREHSISLKRPIVGLAVMPDKPSEPPHFMPTTSSLAGIGSRLNCAA